jgi:hypothetical protein
MKKYLFLILTFLAVNSYAQETPIEPPNKVDKQVKDVVKSPLTDFNLGNDEMPAVLIKAKSQPYALPEDKSCSNLQSEVKDLNSVLGLDYDDKSEEEKKGLANKGAELAGSAAVGALKRTVQDAIPYRGWIRKLSGAEKREKEVAASIAAGTARRAFLKGYASGIGCIEGVKKEEKDEVKYQDTNYFQNDGM